MELCVRWGSGVETRRGWGVLGSEWRREREGGESTLKNGAKMGLVAAIPISAKLTFFLPLALLLGGRRR
jgi:hypothetical protein